jgi:hypothetical protein
VPRRSQNSKVRGAPDCPVPQEDKAPTFDSTPNPNGWVTWRRTGQCTVPVRWRTALSGVSIASSHPNCYGSGWGYKYPPNHLIHNHPSIPNIAFNTRAKDSTQDTSNRFDPLQSLQYNSIPLGFERGCSCVLLLLLLLGLAFFLFFLLLSSAL